MNRTIADDPLARALGELAPAFAARARTFDENDRFVAENIGALKAHKIMSAMVPAAFGGGGVSFQSMCDFLGELAGACASTALCLSMHQHVLATSIVNASLGRPGEKLLRRVAQDQAMIATTVAKDWIGSCGTALPVDGGFVVNAHKTFVSGAPGADLFVTSARTQGAGEVAEVLHFALPRSAAGVEVTGEWRAHGMRGTGSLDVIFRDVFVSAQAVTLRRPASGLHPVFHVILTVAPTLLMATYIGIAKRARQLALDHCARLAGTADHRALGALEGSFKTATLAHRDMVAGVGNFDFEPSLATANAALVAKTIVAKNVRSVCEQAAAIIGAGSFLRASEVERLLRDARAAEFHPMPADRQYEFSGRLMLES